MLAGLVTSQGIQFDLGLANASLVAFLTNRPISQRFIHIIYIYNTCSAHILLQVICPLVKIRACEPAPIPLPFGFILLTRVPRFESNFHPQFLSSPLPTSCLYASCRSLFTCCIHCSLLYWSHHSLPLRVGLSDILHIAARKTSGENQQISLFLPIAVFAIVVVLIFLRWACGCFVSQVSSDGSGAVEASDSRNSQPIEAKKVEGRDSTFESSSTLGTSAERSSHSIALW